MTWSILRKAILRLSTLRLCVGILNARFYLSIVILICFCSCSSTYFNAIEKLGYHKRDILVKRVASAKDSQVEAKKEFRTALERYREVISSSGGDLEYKYNELKSQLNSCESRAAEVRKRIKLVAQVSEALFSEWQDELSTYSNESLKRASEEQLNQSKSQSDRLLAVMREAESKLEPALRPLRDNVLSLKHNLNARAITGLQAESRLINEQVAELVRDLDRSVDEADKYIASLVKNSKGL